MIFFTSDTHFNHANILKILPERVDRLNVITVEDMNNEIISRFNKVVEDTDDLIILGDFLMGFDKEITLPDIMSKLKGRKYLIYGNHDPMSNNKQEFKKIDLYLNSGFIKVCEGPILLSDLICGAPDYLLNHYPYYNESLTCKHKALYPVNTGLKLIHGHTHSHNRRSSSNSIHIGVDAWNYYPVSLEEVDGNFSITS